jgi:hypothetical protein
MRIRGEGPPAAEIEAYCDRLNEMQQAGARFKLIQVYTVARQPAESFVTPIEDALVDAIRDRVIDRTGIPSESFYGSQDAS